jgi:co-chaperonin GroES (HSP10)
MTKTKQLRRLLAVCLAIGVMSTAGVALAATKAPAAKAAPTNLSSTLPQNYNADASVQTGMIVELKSKDPTSVIPLNPSDIKSMLGIVIPASGAAIVLTPQTVTQQQVLVATSGHYNVLVSNQNGPIKVGDYVTISAVAGVGMKADSNELEVIGKAAGAFSGTANVIGSINLKNSLGTTTAVAIGRIPIDMSVSHNPLYQKTADYVPGFLAKIAVNVASKPVSVARIYLSMAILIIISFITGNVLYSGVRSGMIAVGRNPLSRKSIIRSLIQTVIAGLIVFISGVFAVYLLLKL